MMGNVGGQGPSQQVDYMKLLVNEVFQNQQNLQKLTSSLF